MRRAAVFGVACLGLACVQAHPLDSGIDAATTIDVIDLADGRIDPDAGLAHLDSCSLTSLDVLQAERRWVRDDWCRDPLSGGVPLADGLSWYVVDAFVPLTITQDGEDLLLEGLLAHRPDDAFQAICGDPDCPYLLGFRVRYRVRLEGAAPFAALEEATSIDPRAVVDELHAAARETDCGLGSRSGRLVCGSAGRWDAWSHARAVTEPGGGDPITDALLSRREATHVSLALVDREAREVWWVGLQGLPDSCEHPRDMPPAEPCRPRLGPDGAHVMFAMPGTAFCHGRTPCSVSGPAYCPLELTCLSCCPPRSSIYECRDRGFCQGDVDAAWLAEACAATRIQEVPPAPTVPCPATPRDLEHPCLRDVADGVCP